MANIYKDCGFLAAFKTKKADSLPRRKQLVSQWLFKDGVVASYSIYSTYARILLLSCVGALCGNCRVGRNPDSVVMRRFPKGVLTSFEIDESQSLLCCNKATDVSIVSCFSYDSAAFASKTGYGRMRCRAGLQFRRLRCCHMLCAFLR